LEVTQRKREIVYLAGEEGAKKEKLSRETGIGKIMSLMRWRQIVLQARTPDGGGG